MTEDHWELVATPPTAKPGDLIHLVVQGRDAHVLVGGLMSHLESVDGELLYALIARRDLTDAGYVASGGNFRHKPVGIGGGSPIPARIPPLPAGQYVIRRDFRGRRLRVRPIRDDWEGDPEDRPYSGPSYESVALTTHLDVVDA